MMFLGMMFIQIDLDYSWPGMVVSAHLGMSEIVASQRLAAWPWLVTKIIRMIH